VSRRGRAAWRRDCAVWRRGRGLVPPLDRDVLDPGRGVRLRRAGRIEDDLFDVSPRDEHRRAAQESQVVRQGAERDARVVGAKGGLAAGHRDQPGYGQQNGDRGEDHRDREDDRGRGDRLLPQDAQANGNKADGQASGGLAGQPIAFFVAARVRRHASMFPPAAGNRQ
jgi:hypothetical protein